MRCYAEDRSKWYVSALSTSKDAMSTERTYVLSTLSRGIARGLGDAVLRFDAGGMGAPAELRRGLSARSRDSSSAA
jgi:hypothetical protein